MIFVLCKKKKEGFSFSSPFSWQPGLALPFSLAFFIFPRSLHLPHPSLLLTPGPTRQALPLPPYLQTLTSSPMQRGAGRLCARAHSALSPPKHAINATISVAATPSPPLLPFPLMAATTMRLDGHELRPLLSLPAFRLPRPSYKWHT